jgi:ribonuclease Z
MDQHITVLGAGTALPDRDRDNTFLVWNSAAGDVLIDCGGRAYSQLLRAECDPLRINTVLLTHNHPDHIYGVPAFLFHLWLAKRTAPVDVYANPSTLTMSRALCDALELEEAGHMCATLWHELPETEHHLVCSNPSYSVYTTPVRHSRPTLAVKIEDHERRRTLVYSADTEPCLELERFAQGTHTLIHEATTSNPYEGHGHTTPRQAGEIAARCGVEHLILIHYSARYTMPEDKALDEVRAGGFEGHAEVAQELKSYTI